MKQFGPNCPPNISNLAETNPYGKHEFVHCVSPNEERVHSDRGFKGMEFSSFYVSAGTNSVVERGGYKTWPFGIGRYSVAPLENYGRGPGSTAFAAIRTLNEEKKTILRAGQKSVDPPTLLYEEGVLEAFNQRAGAANYGMLTADGQPLAVPFENKANIPLGLELMNIEKGDVSDAFLVSLFQFLSERTEQMTAAEVYARQAQVAMMLAPTMGRQQSEYLGPIIHRELQVGFDCGVFDAVGPMPRALAKRGGAYSVDYTSPLARAARAPEATAILQTLQSMGQMAQIDPDVIMRFDLDLSMQEVADINGMPAKLIRSDEQVAALKQQKQQQAQAAAIAQHAPGLSMAELNLAKARQADSTIGGGPAPQANGAAGPAMPAQAA